MEKGDSKFNFKKALLALAITLIGPAIWIVTLFYPQMIESNLNLELQNLSELIGEEATLELYQSVLDSSDSILIESGFIGEVREILLPREYLRGEPTVFGGDAMWSAVDQAVYGLTLSVDFTLLRLYAFKVWVLAIIVITVASAISGYWNREIKKHGFEFSSPLLYDLGRKTLYSIPIVALMYLIIPFYLPAFIVPMATIIYSGAVLLVVANTVKRA
ncbi:DUF4400 domain-containing protein [Vibrio coralliilyticus]|uniref:DUF4400 domain-containing protein n=1 Tax=Vibrio coralliilyticus TaxID=190893 RepID=A0AAP6ZUG0_9VIBR|nr:DUF4400 domain-containing protein [Vibrio coralliilyticus]NOI31833.1 DUF4400 domain-containing protein [Vibrio coralliilyticus]NOJ25277.1 DUF4400 domain-containing protein [Vibrio coralliilyticus]